MARDESRDVGVAIDEWEVFPWNQAKGLIGLWEHHVPHDQLEAAEKRIAELESELKEANARLATVSPQAVQELALAARMMAIPRCKDGCEHWNPGDSEIGLPYCQHDFGLIGPQEDGSSFCPYHSRLRK